MRGLVQFVRDLALLPTMWRLLVKGARSEALLDGYLDQVSRQHPDLPFYEQKSLAIGLRARHGFPETLAAVRHAHPGLPESAQTDTARTLWLKYDDAPLRAEEGYLA